MSEPLTPEERRARLAVRRLLDAVDRALAVVREVQAARVALDRAAQRVPRLRVVPSEVEDSRANGEVAHAE